MFYAVPGKFVVTTGPNSSFQFVTSVREYAEAEKKEAHGKAMQALTAEAEKQRRIEREMRGE
jgi:hypothetical protein